MQTQKDSYATRYADSTKIASLCTMQNLMRPKRRLTWQTTCSLDEVKRILWQCIIDAVKQLSNGTSTPVALPQYAEVAEWLFANNGKGLLLYGTCGQGKTLLARYVIPWILKEVNHKICQVYDATDLDTCLKDVLSHPIVSLDDIGTETTSMFKDMAVARIIDQAEKMGNIVIATTNLTGEQLRERYGDRIFDRICGNMVRIMFDGKTSFRR